MYFKESLSLLSHIIPYRSNTKIVGVCKIPAFEILKNLDFSQPFGYNRHC